MLQIHEFNEEKVVSKMFIPRRASTNSRYLDWKFSQELVMGCWSECFINSFGVFHDMISSVKGIMITGAQIVAMNLVSWSLKFQPAATFCNNV